MGCRTVKLGSVISHRKEFIIIDNSVEYKRCRVQVNRKGVVLRDVIKGSLINTKKQQVCKEGDFLVAEIDAKVGGYGFVGKELEGAIVSSHYFLFDVDETRILKAFLAWLIKTDIIQEQINSKGSTNYAAIRPASVLNFEIPLPSIEEQFGIVNKLNNVYNEYLELQNELVFQEANLRKLRQAILREAVEGKLTKKDSTDEPASKLLGQIHAERNQQVTEGKPKRERPLPSISEEEIPFDMPKGWAWCRLGEIGKISGGGTPSKNHAEYWSGDIPWVTPKDMKSETIRDSIDHISMAAVNSSSAKFINSGSILIVVRGMILIKNVPIAINAIPVTINQDMKAISLYHQDLTEYMRLYLMSRQGELKALVERSTHGTGKLGTEVLTDLVIPIPPLREQFRIVTKVQHLLQKLDQLSQHVEQNQAQSKQLFRAVLKEAIEVA